MSDDKEKLTNMVNNTKNDEEKVEIFNLKPSTINVVEKNFKPTPTENTKPTPTENLKPTPTKNTVTIKPIPADKDD